MTRYSLYLWGQKSTDSAWIEAYCANHPTYSMVRSQADLYWQTLGFNYAMTSKPSLKELGNAVLDVLDDRDLNNLQRVDVDNAKGRAFNLFLFGSSFWLALYIPADSLQVANPTSEIQSQR